MKWITVKIPEVLFFQEGPGVRNWQFKESGVKLLNVGNINNGQINLATTKLFLSEEEAFGKYAHFLVDSGDLLIACSGIVLENFHNKIAFVKEEDLPLCLNTSTMRFKPLDKAKFNLNFFKYFLQTKFFNVQLSRLITGSAQLNFGPSHIKKIDVLVPPLAEQEKIAAILDAADLLRQKDQALIEHYTALGQALFLDMFGDPVTNPMGWEVQNLGQIISFMTSGSRGWAKYYSDNGDLFLRIQNVGKNQLMLDDVAYVLAPESAEAKRTVVQAKDILLSITADLGRTAVIPENLPKAYINQHLAIIRLQKSFNSVYVSEFIVSEGGKRQFLKLDKGGVKAGLNFEDIKSLKILLPPLELQTQFDQRIAHIEAQKELAKQNLAQSQALFESLLHRAFTGELTQ